MKKQLRTTLLLTALIFTKMISAQSTINALVLSVKGDVGNPLQLTLRALEGFTQTSAVIKDREGNNHTYAGVAIKDILDSAKATTGKQLRGENLKKYLLVKCADGYQVLFSLAELDPDFGNRKVILAHKVDGQPLPEGKGPFRLIVPDDKALARNSFEVTEFIIGFARD